MKSYLTLCLIIVICAGCDSQHNISNDALNRCPNGTRFACLACICSIVRISCPSFGISCFIRHRTRGGGSLSITAFYIFFILFYFCTHQKSEAANMIFSWQCTQYITVCTVNSYRRKIITACFESVAPILFTLSGLIKSQRSFVYSLCLLWNYHPLQVEAEFYWQNVTRNKR